MPSTKTRSIRFRTKAEIPLFLQMRNENRWSKAHENVFQSIKYPSILGNRDRQIKRWCRISEWRPFLYIRTVTKNVAKLPKFQQIEWQRQNFQQKLTDSRFYACAVKRNRRR